MLSFFPRTNGALRRAKHLLLTVITIMVATVLTNGATLVVPSGGDFQAALNAANCGDTIVLQAGGSYVVATLEQPFLAKAKGPCSGTSADFITIQGSNFNALPASLRDLSPSQISALSFPKLITKVSTPALEFQAGSHHYRFVGIEITNDSVNQTQLNNGLVFVGVNSGSQLEITLANVPRDIEFDRCYVHSESSDGTTSEYSTSIRGFWASARNLTIKHSRIAGFRTFWKPGQTNPLSSNAVLIERGPGPYTIVNNYMEAWFGTVFTGGMPQWVVNKASVAPGATTNQATLTNVVGTLPSVGDYIAFLAPNMIFEVGVFHGQPYEWGAAKVTAVNGSTISYVPMRSNNLQSAWGTGFGGTPLTSAPSSPGMAVWNGDRPKDILIQHNKLVKEPVSLAAVYNQYGYSSKGHIELKVGLRTTINANTFEGYHLAFVFTPRNQSTMAEGGGKNVWSTLDDTVFTNNWVKPAPGVGQVFGIQLDDETCTVAPGSGMRIENNLFESGTKLVNLASSKNVQFIHNTFTGNSGLPTDTDQVVFSYGGPAENLQLRDNIFYNNSYGMNCQLTSTPCWPGLGITGNVVIDNRTAAEQLFQGPLSGKYPAGNYYSNTLAGLQFVDAANGNWRLSASSPYKGRGTNGTDPGVNMDTLVAALSAAYDPGSTPTPTPTPVPTPTPTPVPTPTPTPVPTPTPTPVPTPTPTPVPTPTPTPVPTPPPPAPSANTSFVGLDTTTKGNWKNAYGSQGYNTINDAMSYPSYAQITVSGYTSPYWDDSTTDVRALQKAVGTDRVAARWSANSSFTIDLNMTDGQPHRVALYCLDWDGNNRSQRIEIRDWATGAVLDTRSISSFNGGQYLVWDIRGRVRLVVTRTGAKTAVLSGLYFGAAGPSPTPTPTPIPTPSPFPTPTPSPGSNNSPYVSVISPAVNSVFGTGSNVTIQSSAGDSDGSISRVDFYRSGSLIGTATSSPYNCVWANVPSGNYSLTAVATDNLGARATSSPVAVSIKNSPASVNKARGRGNNLLTNLGSTTTYGGGEESYTAAALTEDLNLLVNDVQTAYTDYVAERSTFGSTADHINTQLSAALYLSKSDAALAAKVGSSTSVRNHLLRLVAHLAVSEDLMLYGSITPTTQAQAAAATARLDLVIGPAHPSYTLNGAAQFAPLSLGSAFADAASAPLTSQTFFANIGADGSVPYELGGVNVTVGGKAVPVLYVSPSRISFHVTGDVPLGPVDVIVTSQNGLVSRGVTNIAPNLIQFMTKTDDPYGAGLAVNDNKQTPEIFDVITTENFGPDKRTRVTVFATGISGSANNWDPSNDVVVGGVVRKNFAESITVIARLNEGALITLPVEFAGTQGKLPGLDQVNFVLTHELAGAGPIEMTIFVNGQRSNAPKIVVR